MCQDHPHAPHGKTIRAAVLRQPKQPLGFETATLEAPRNNEVLVRMVATGVCHTDMVVRDQLYSTGMPMILGHEGAGIVEQVGAGVTTVAVGDHVVMTVGKAACRNARPTNAGLNTLLPRPPHTSLPRPMATKPPRNAIQSGKPGGSVSPRRTPVSAALPSLSGARLGLVDENIHSVAIAPSMLVAVTSNALIPKYQIETNHTTHAAMRTSSMRRGVVTPSRRNGAVWTRSRGERSVTSSSPSSSPGSPTSPPG